MNKPLLLTGANGRTGRAVLQAMVHAKIAVRAFIRDAAQADDLMALGASEHAVGDLTDRASLRRAVEGAGKVLHIGPPMHEDEFAITRDLIDCAKESGVSHFIYYSVMHPLARSIRHHSLKLDAEEYLINSGIAHTILQPSRYMQHLEPLWRAVIDQGEHAMPFDVDQKFSVVDLFDLAAACAVVAGSDKFAFGTYELAGPQALSQTDMARILSEELGRPVAARKVEVEQMQGKARKAGASDDRIAQITLMNQHYDAHGFRSNAQVLQFILGRPATSYRSYVKRLIREKGG